MQIDKDQITQAPTRKGHFVTEFSARTRSQEQIGEDLGPVAVTESSAFQLSSSECARSQLKDPRPSLVPCSPPRSNSPSAQKPRVMCLGLLPPYQTVPATQFKATEIEVSVAEQANRMPAMCGRGERQEGEDTAEEAVSGRSLEMGRHVETTTHMHHLPLAAQHVTRSRTQHNPNIQNTQSSVHKPAVISI